MEVFHSRYWKTCMFSQWLFSVLFFTDAFLSTLSVLNWQLYSPIPILILYVMYDVVQNKAISLAFVFTPVGRYIMVHLNTKAKIKEEQGPPSDIKLQSFRLLSSLFCILTGKITVRFEQYFLQWGSPWHKGCPFNPFKGSLQTILVVQQPMR